MVEPTECPVCFETFQRPTLLPCGHTFCLRCLKRLAENTFRAALVCPMCRHEVQRSYVRQCEEHYFTPQAWQHYENIDNYTGFAGAVALRNYNVARLSNFYQPHAVNTLATRSRPTNFNRSSSVDARAMQRPSNFNQSSSLHAAFRQLPANSNQCSSINHGAIQEDYMPRPVSFFSPWRSVNHGAISRSAHISESTGSNAQVTPCNNAQTTPRPTAQDISRRILTSRTRAASVDRSARSTVMSRPRQMSISNSSCRDVVFTPSHPDVVRQRPSLNSTAAPITQLIPTGRRAVSVSPYHVGLGPGGITFLDTASEVNQPSCAESAALAAPPLTSRTAGLGNPTRVVLGVNRALDPEAQSKRNVNQSLQPDTSKMVSNNQSLHPSTASMTNNNQPLNSRPDVFATPPSLAKIAHSDLPLPITAPLSIAAPPSIAKPPAMRPTPGNVVMHSRAASVDPLPRLGVATTPQSIAAHRRMMNAHISLYQAIPQVAFEAAGQRMTSSSAGPDAHEQTVTCRSTASVDPLTCHKLTTTPQSATKSQHVVTRPRVASVNPFQRSNSSTRPQSATARGQAHPRALSVNPSLGPTLTAPQSATEPQQVATHSPCASANPLPRPTVTMTERQSTAEPQHIVTGRCCLNVGRSKVPTMTATASQSSATQTRAIDTGQSQHPAADHRVKNGRVSRKDGEAAPIQIATLPAATRISHEPRQADRRTSHVTYSGRSSRAAETTYSTRIGSASFPRIRPPRNITIDGTVETKVIEEFYENTDRVDITGSVYRVHVYRSIRHLNVYGVVEKLVVTGTVKCLTVRSGGKVHKLTILGSVDVVNVDGKGTVVELVIPGCVKELNVKGMVGELIVSGTVDSQNVAGIILMKTIGEISDDDDDNDEDKFRKPCQVKDSSGIGTNRTLASLFGVLGHIVRGSFKLIF